MDAFVVQRQRIAKLKTLKKFKQNLANTNYIGPQLAKNIDRKEYFKILNDWLYQTASVDFKNLELTNLYQVVRIATSMNKCSVLTFNYDDVFERLSESEFPETTWTTIYANMKNAKEERNKDHTVLHLHGFLPRGKDPGKVLQKSIVLSSMEYMNAYRSGRMFCYKNLIKQLHTTNLIIGNSISDYEEQKVLKENISSRPYEYQFMLTKKNDELWMDRCQSLFLIQIGVIPVYFSSFEGMNQYLQQL